MCLELVIVSPQSCSWSECLELVILSLTSYNISGQHCHTRDPWIVVKHPMLVIQICALTKSAHIVCSSRCLCDGRRCCVICNCSMFAISHACVRSLQGCEITQVPRLMSHRAHQDYSQVSYVSYLFHVSEALSCW